MIIQQLLNDGICFAVVQSNSFLTKAKIMFNQEYEVIASEKVNKEMTRRFTRNAGPYLPQNQKNPEGIISYKMNSKEIREFRSLKEEHFKKVISNENGTVWELNGNSFKAYLKTLKHGSLRIVS